jgi:hypothetical protein
MKPLTFIAIKKPENPKFTRNSTENNRIGYSRIHYLQNILSSEYIIFGCISRFVSSGFELVCFLQFIKNNKNRKNKGFFLKNTFKLF